LPQTWLPLEPDDDADDEDEDVPPDELVPLELEPVDVSPEDDPAPVLELVDDGGATHSFGGTQSDTGLFSTEEYGLQTRPGAHACPLEQSVPQNESPPICPHSLPAPQSLLVTHGLQVGQPAPAPVLPPEPVVSPPTPPPGSCPGEAHAVKSPTTIDKVRPAREMQRYGVMVMTSSHRGTIFTKQNTFPLTRESIRNAS
jgi:hypothetical protein